MLMSDISLELHRLSENVDPLEEPFSTDTGCISKSISKKAAYVLRGFPGARLREGDDVATIAYGIPIWYILP